MFWDLRFSFAVNSSLLAHLALVASMCVVLTREVGIEREMVRTRETRRENSADLGKVPHHTVCPADTTNSPPCVCGGEGLLKDSPLISDAASHSRLDPPSPPFNSSLIITSRLCSKAVTY